MRSALSFFSLAVAFVFAFAFFTTARASFTSPARRSHHAIQARASSPNDYLSAHNAVRAAHGAHDLAWSDALAAKAAEWAGGCQFRHSDGALGPDVYGENLAAAAGSFSADAAVKVFTNDEDEYDASHPTYNHFTQVVWKASTELGCAAAKCSGIFDAKYGKATYHVCLYNPPGNVVGAAQRNVQV